MADLTLIVGNKNYSSWSLRPFLALRHAGLAFDDVVVPLRRADTAEQIGAHSPSGRVPVLHHGDLTVWDSLAICEYVADLAPGARLWPSDRAARAVARSVSAEMHSGFAALRNAMPMNVRASRPGRTFAADVEADVERVKTVWSDCRARHGAGGPFLFGAFSVADCMYAPVVSRFRTHGVMLSGTLAAYADAVWLLPALQDWVEAARREPGAIAAYDEIA